MGNNDVIRKWALNPSNKAKFSWSYSRSETFESCKRKYFYNYYAASGGYKDDAPEIIRHIYKLKNQTSLALFRGSVVHEILAELIREYKLMGYVLVSDKRISELVWKHVKDIPDELIPSRNKFGFYTARETEVRFRDKLIADLEEAIHSAVRSDVFQLIMDTPRENILEIDPPFNKFMFNATTVYAIPDVLFKDGAGITIVDWKTGKIPSMAKQASIYALYAKTKYNEDAVRVLAYGIDEQRTVVARLKDKADTANLITLSAFDMKLHLDDNGLADMEKFPKTDNDFKCRYCPFKEICE